MPRRLARSGAGSRASPLTDRIAIEIDNRSSFGGGEHAMREVCLRVLAAEGVDSCDLGVALVGREEIRALKRAHLGIDQETDVLSFPLDAKEPLPPGVPRQLGDVVLCPELVGTAWKAPLVHGLLHLLGYDHGRAMEEREQDLLQ
jgi:probable rRNA maturation factor